MKKVYIIIGFVLLISLCGFLIIQQINKPRTMFTLISPEKSGVKFINHLPVNLMSDENVLSYQYYYNGSGVAIGDINNDGLPDIYLTANKKKNRLYLNKGNLVFEDITDKAGVGTKRFSTGSCFSDVNQDGFLDLYVCNSGPYKKPINLENQLFINLGNGKFIDKAEEYGVNDSNHSTQAAFFDYDSDGDLDLYVMNHSVYFRINLGKVFEMIKDENTLRKVSGKLYENKNGKFTDVTKKAGLLAHSYGLGLSVSDINNDGFPDLYIANDFTIPDFFYINNGNGTFTDKQKELTRQIPWFGMGSDIADINNDGLLDIGVLDMAANDHIRSKTLMAAMSPTTFYTLVEKLGYQYQYMFNSFQLNNGNGTFSNIGNLTGTAKTDWSWSALFADFDNDGYKDYFVTNGFRKNTLDNDFQIEIKNMKNKYPNGIPLNARKIVYRLMPEIKLPNYLFLNKGQLKFENVAEKIGLGEPSFSNGASYSDLDLDGDLDLVINNVDQVAFLYRNNTSEAQCNKFLRIDLHDKTNQSNFYNAKVTVFNGNKLQLQEYSPTRGYKSAVEHVLHFGFGCDTEIIDSVVVKWIDGKTKKLSNVPTNQTLKISKNNALQKSLTKKSVKSLFHEVDPTKYGIDFIHKENDFDDFDIEGLLPHRQSRLGPFASVGDINQDGLDDIFIGGASGQGGKMFIQKANGKFTPSNSQPWDEDRLSEDMNSLFFDYDNDDDLDLYVVSGGSGEFEIDSWDLQDRIYENDGSGNFTKSKNILPNMLTSGQQVKAADIDLDGDLDLFIGGRVIPGKYPYSPESFLLINNDGIFTNEIDKWAPQLSEIGLVTDFLFTDFNKDGMIDLIVVGEWMSVFMMANTGEEFINRSKEFQVDDLRGWWYSIEEGDFNLDGIPDYLLGNIGKNIKFKASKKEPFHIYTNDFDDTGDQDIVLSSYYKGRLVPSRGRECSSGEMPFITDVCKTYEEFANASIEDIFGTEKLIQAKHLEANIFESILLLSSSNGKYERKSLNIEAQMSPVNRFVVKDIDGDGFEDIVLGGNMFHTEVETPRYDAGRGLFLKGNGIGEFEALPVLESGIYIPGDVKDIDFLIVNGNQALFVCNNNETPQIFIKN